MDAVKGRFFHRVGLPTYIFRITRLPSPANPALGITDTFPDDQSSTPCSRRIL